MPLRWTWNSAGLSSLPARSPAWLRRDVPTRPSGTTEPTGTRPIQPRLPAASVPGSATPSALQRWHLAPNRAAVVEVAAGSAAAGAAGVGRALPLADVPQGRPWDILPGPSCFRHVQAAGQPHALYYSSLEATIPLTCRDRG